MTKPNISFCNLMVPFSVGHSQSAVKVLEMKRQQLIPISSSWATYYNPTLILHATSCNWATVCQVAIKNYTISIYFLQETGTTSVYLYPSQNWQNWLKAACLFSIVYSATSITVCSIQQQAAGDLSPSRVSTGDGKVLETYGGTSSSWGYPFMDVYFMENPATNG